MPLAVVGINHKTAPVEIREKVAFGRDELPSLLKDICAKPDLREAVILSTCNRTEIYCELEQADDPAPGNWLIAHHRTGGEDLHRYLYRHRDEAAVHHLLCVACGLDSMVLGEPQILGQIKDAYQIASDADTAGPVLNRLFQHAFFVAKKVRTDTAIGSSPVSVAFAAVRLAQQIHGDLAGKAALLIGAGDTIELAAHHLHENRLGRMLVANRSLERAQTLASRFSGYALPLADLGKHLAEADIVIASTASPVAVLTRRDVEQAMIARRRRPMFLVDIAVPRDIDPAAAEIEDVYLYTIDDLQAVIDENLRSRQAAALKAREIIDSETGHFLDWLQQGDAVAALKSLRGRAEARRDELLAKALQEIRLGAPVEETLRTLAVMLTNKLLHEPTVKLKELGSEGRDDLVQLARKLFDLDTGR